MFPFFDKGTGGQMADEFMIDFGIKGKIEGLKGFFLPRRKLVLTEERVSSVLFFQSRPAQGTGGSQDSPERTFGPDGGEHRGFP
jgi:hypothetical protein